MFKPMRFNIKDKSRFSYFFGYINENLRNESENLCAEIKTISIPNKCRQNSSATDYFEDSSSEIEMSFNEHERFDPTKRYQPGPLKFEIRLIRHSKGNRTNSPSNFPTINAYNSSQIMILNKDSSEGRTFITSAVLMSRMIAWSWTMWRFLFVNMMDYMWTRLKYLMGYSNESYSLSITVGHDHIQNKKDQHQRNDNVLNNNNHHHGGWGWPPKKHPHSQHNHHHHNGIVHKAPFQLYHPASKYFEQPAIQYSPQGTKYTLHAYDQLQALKYNKKYEDKFQKYKRKYYWKKGKEIRKAEKAAKRKQKANRKRKKFEAFGERIKEWFDFLDRRRTENQNGYDGDDVDGDEQDIDDKKNDDLREQNWKGSSAEIEHGKPPPPLHSYYKPGENYDPTPVFGRPPYLQQHLRIMG